MNKVIGYLYTVYNFGGIFQTLKLMTELSLQLKQTKLIELWMAIVGSSVQH